MPRKNPLPVPTEQDIEQAVTHVRYEANGVHDLLLKMRTLPPPAVPPGEPTLENRTILEAFLLHSRNLRDFLIEPCDKNGASIAKEDDVLARHFVKDASTWTPDGKSDSPYLEAQRERLNKALAHLSYRREQYRLGDWDCNKIYRELAVLWERFLAALPQDRAHRFDGVKLSPPDATTPPVPPQHTSSSWTCTTMAPPQFPRPQGG